MRTSGRPPPGQGPGGASAGDQVYLLKGLWRAQEVLPAPAMRKAGRGGTSLPVFPDTAAILLPKTRERRPDSHRPADLQGSGGSAAPRPPRELCAPGV